MDITFKKKMENLQREVTLKSADLKESVEDFKVEIEECAVSDKFINISPQCVRCNLCVQECPVDAITDADAVKQAKILENCVKCEICAQTCPVGCINVVETMADVNENVQYRLNDIKVPHRLLRMNNISVDSKKCNSCGTCAKFCPTQAITVENEEIAHINKELCIGCGACANVCDPEAITLERVLGPIIETKELLIDQEACVECFVCEENCPTGAIKLENGDVILDKDKCILCEVCSTKCPVSALKLERLAHES
ncbi:4Fe-4S binding protein [Methanobacterium alcaliphilum]|uniref:4Fe-4S binding protein n=1 Tax=Methanobacterium alcaliphilum TaxID=392018 RepID=UPI00200AB00C|nr:4Fe-4S binding protein [Methanobacterium alcaliphilum]MCK9150725.1 4Fe-4S binding protein [Methanobacterium alcaliphilum]